MSETALRRLWAVAVAALATFIGWSSLAAQPPLAPESLSDKAGHFLAYLSLGLLASGITAPGRLPATMLRCFLLGAALEIAQGLLTPGRQAEWGDLAANAAGIAIAWAVAARVPAAWALRLLGQASRGRAP